MSIQNIDCRVLESFSETGGTITIDANVGIIGGLQVNLVHSDPSNDLQIISRSPTIGATSAFKMGSNTIEMYANSGIPVATLNDNRFQCEWVENDRNGSNITSLTYAPASIVMEIGLGGPSVTVKQNKLTCTRVENFRNGFDDTFIDYEPTRINMTVDGNPTVVVTQDRMDCDWFHTSKTGVTESFINYLPTDLEIDAPDILINSQDQIEMDALNSIRMFVGGAITATVDTNGLECDNITNDTIGQSGEKHDYTGATVKTIVGNNPIVTVHGNRLESTWVDNDKNGSATDYMQYATNQIDAFVGGTSVCTFAPTIVGIGTRTFNAGSVQGLSAVKGTTGSPITISSETPPLGPSVAGISITSNDLEIYDGSSATSNAKFFGGGLTLSGVSYAIIGYTGVVGALGRIIDVVDKFVWGPQDLTDVVGLELRSSFYTPDTMEFVFIELPFPDPPGNFVVSGIKVLKKGIYDVSAAATGATGGVAGSGMILYVNNVGAAFSVITSQTAPGGVVNETLGLSTTLTLDANDVVSFGKNTPTIVWLVSGSFLSVKRRSPAFNVHVDGAAQGPI